MTAPVYRYAATMIDNYDGDTFRAVVDLGFRVSTTIHVRVYGVDTPEIKDADPVKKAAARAAKEFTRSLLAGQTFVLESYKDRESFARWVCRVWVNGEDLGDLLIAAGHGVELMRDA